LAQQATKRPLTHRDYDSWRSIQGQVLSPDGKYLAYSLVPQEGDGEVVVHNLQTGTEWRYPRGGRSSSSGGEPPTAVPPARFGATSTPSASIRMQFAADSRTFLFAISPIKAELDQAKKDKKKPEEMPRPGLALVDLASGKVTRLEKVKSFQVPEEAA